MVAPPTATMLSGIVKAVPSGDTLVVMKQMNPVSGPPPEMRLTLSSLKAPLLSREARSDEPYAWASRQYLRSKLIGQTVSFRIDYRVESLSRTFATVFENGADVSINIAIVDAGFARVRQPNAAQNEDVSPEFEALVDAEARASAAGLALHSSAAASVSRNIPPAAEPLLQSGDLANALAGRTFPAVVEYVANGSFFKLFAHDIPSTSKEQRADRLFVVSLTGVQSPGFRRAEGEDPSTPPKPMPYANNARFLSEIRLLHRDVQVTIDGIDRNGVLFATVRNPTAKLYIGEELLRTGLAKTVSWGLDRSPHAPSLRTAERTARDRQLGLWKDFQETTAAGESFKGKVAEVVSGDMLAIMDDTTGKVRRITLASVRASRADRPGRDRSTMPTGPAADGKEALRKKLIGRRVTVNIEYSRDPSSESVRKEVMTFATVCKDDGKNVDVALALISNGFLTVMRHRGDEDHATNYEEYLEREAAALSAKRGIHSGAENGGVRVNNLTGPDAKKRSRDVLAGLQRGGPYKGVIEYVTSGARYRIYLPSQSMLITLGLQAVRCPQPTRRSYDPDGSVREEVPGDAHGDDSAEFARDLLMQRDVEVEVMNVDRMGAFLGNVFLTSQSGERTNITSLLLQTGHGYIHESFDPKRDRGGALYSGIELKAREAKAGVWSDYVEPISQDAGDDAGVSTTVRRRFVGKVCEIGFGGRIFVQDSKTSTATLASVESGLAAMSLDKVGEVPLSSLKPGAVVGAKFSVDGRWYRAKVAYVHKGEGADVRFMDYGNEERVAAKDLRKLGAGATLGVPAVAVEVALAHVVVPDEDDVNGIAAGDYLNEMVYGREVEVAVMGNEGNSKVIGDISIPAAKGANGGGSSSDGAGSGDGAAAVTSLREELLKSGLARIVRKKDRVSQEAFEKFRPLEEIAIRGRQYIWSQGEVVGSDDDEEVDTRHK